MIYANIIGHLGTDAQKKEKDGKTVINFNIASNVKIAGRDKVTWISCYLNRNSGVFDYLKKGTMVYVAGDLNIDVFQKDSTEAILSVTLVVAKLELLKERG